jgi:hypothetical protein
MFEFTVTDSLSSSVGNILWEKNIFRHVLDEHKFKDGYYYYIFIWTRDELLERKKMKNKDNKAMSSKKFDVTELGQQLGMIL